MSEHAGNCGYVQKGMPCDCGLWEQSATLFKLQERIRDLEAVAKAVIDRWDTPAWKDAPATATYINALRATVDRTGEPA